MNQLPSTRLQPYLRVVLGQPESGVFTRKLQFELVRVDLNQPRLEAV